MIGAAAARAPRPGPPCKLDTHLWRVWHTRAERIGQRHDVKLGGDVLGMPALIGCASASASNWAVPVICCGIPARSAAANAVASS